MAERKVVIMYKDVWKKFGAKILIVACSILLLGGVAIVAPRLRAAGVIDAERPLYQTPEDLTKLQTWSTSGQIKVVNGSRQDITDQLFYTGDTIYPDYLKIDNHIYSRDIDFIVEPEQNVECTNAGKKKVKIVALDSQSGSQFKFNGNFTYQYTILPKQVNAQTEEKFTFEYEIPSKYDTDSFSEDQREDIYYRQNRLIIAGNVELPKFTVKIDGKELNVDGNNCSLCQEDGTEISDFAKLIGTKEIYFKLNNYVYNNSNMFHKSARIIKHIKDAGVYVKDGGNKTLIEQWGGSVNKKPTAEMVEVTGNPAGISTPNCEANKSDGSGPRIKVTGNENECYGVVWSLPYTVTSTDQNAKFRLVTVKKDASGNKVRDKLPGSFKIPYQEGTNPDGSGGTYLITSMPESVKEQYMVEKRVEGGEWEFIVESGNWWDAVQDADDSKIIDSNTRKPLTGATAGTVRQSITVDGVSGTGEMEYDVVRSLGGEVSELGDEKMNGNLVIEGLEDANETAYPSYPEKAFDYSKNQSFALRPIMHFKGSEYKLKYSANAAANDGGDFTVTYKTIKEDGTEADGCNQAGTVIMTVTGKGGYAGTSSVIIGEENGGMLQKLMYKIAQIEIGDPPYKTTLSGMEMEAGAYVFSVGLSNQKIKQEIISKARFSDGSNVLNINSLKEGIDYEISFYEHPKSTDSDAIDINGPSFQPGYTYEAQVVFKGNYTTPKGKELKCNFTIREYTWNQVEASLGSCNTAWCVSSSAIHYYDGEDHPHKPDVVVVDKDTKVPLEKGVAYFIDEDAYKDNDKAGEATVTVRLAGPSRRTKTFTFTIRPCELNQENTHFTEDEFTKEPGNPDKWTHKFLGKDTVPPMTQLGVLYRRGKPAKILKVNEDFRLLDDTLYYLDGSQYVSWDEVSFAEAVTKGYYYHIGLTNSNYKTSSAANDLYVGPFMFETKPINQAEIWKAEDAFIEEYTSGDENKTGNELEAIIKKFLQDKDQFTIKDANGTELKINDDYIIEMADGSKGINNIKDDGTIVFQLKGQGFYTGYTDQIAFNVGKAIWKTKIYEGPLPDDPRTKDVPFEDKVATLQHSYTDSGITDGDRYGFYFDTGDTARRVISWLYDGNNKDSGKKLLWGKHYGIEINNYGTPISDGNRIFYEIPIKGKLGYYGTASLKFEVKKRNINNCIITEVPNVTYEYEWNSVPIPVQLNVTYGQGGEPLVEGTDYRIIYNNTYGGSVPTTAGEHKYQLQGLGRYAIENNLTPIKTYNIQARSLGETISGGAIQKSTRVEVVGLNLNGYEYKRGGVKPSVNLQYTYYQDNQEMPPVTLTGNDYEASYENVTHTTTTADTADEHAKIVFTGKGNFKDSFSIDFTILPVDLGDGNCFITLKNLPRHFEAKDIVFNNIGDVDTKEMAVFRYDDSTKTKYSEIPPSEYRIEYTGNYYVSGGVTGPNSTRDTFVQVFGKHDGNVKSKEDEGNYDGDLSAPFIIKGDLSVGADTTSGTAISRVDVKTHKIPYLSLLSGSSSTSGMKVSFWQKQRSGDSVAYTDRELEWKTDYKVCINNGDDITQIKSPRIGVYGADQSYIEGIGDYFEGQKATEVIISGDLSSTDERETKVTLKDSNDTNIIVKIPNGEKPEDQKLESYITVMCGGIPLEHDVHYRFNTRSDLAGGDRQKPDMRPGKHIVYIEPIPGSKEERYLENSRKIEYEVKQSLTDADYSVTGIEPNASFEYNHGKPVIRLENIKVSVGGNELWAGTDYQIAFKDNDGSSVGDDHAVVITPDGNYAGNPYSIPFTVTQYDLEAALKRKDLSFTAKPSAIYTGDDVFPKVESVTANTIEGAGIKESVPLYGNNDEWMTDENKRPEDGEAAYELRSMFSYDNVNYDEKYNVNYSKGETVKCYLSGVGNYTGKILLEYKINQKEISDEDVTFTTPLGDNYEYLNGDPIKPEPIGTYNNKPMVGKEHKGNDSVAGVDYTYTYPDNVIDAGEKKIHITGQGNFTGQTDLDYKVKPLDLEHTKLEFAQEEIIYDGTSQKPSFTLSYNDKQILSYDKASGVHSDYIKDVKVEFGGDGAEKDNINATTSGHFATVKLSFDPDKNSNYEGTKTAQFTIQPASLEGHVAFMYHPEGEAGNMEINSNLHLSWTGESQKLDFPANIASDTELEEKKAGAFYDFAGKNNNGSFLKPTDNKDATVGNGDYTIAFEYVEPDSEDILVREDYGNEAGRENCTLAGKVRVTITGINNYKDSASFWYYIGDDISADGSAKLQTNTAIYNAKKQPPTVIVSGISRDKYTVARYRGEVKNENFITEKDIIDAATYYIRLEGNPTKGTYATKPITLTYTIQPRAISNSVVIDGFKKEYNYTGLAICPVGISVTDYIDRTKYKLTENEDYSLTYTNNINVGTATINVNGEGNFKGTAAARFAITSSMISGGSNGTPGGSVSNGSGQISGAVAVAPDDVRVTLDAGNAMYYTGKQLTPAVTISGMTQNTDYTVTYSNNIEVGTGVITITGMGNNTGTITKNFRIVAKLSDCKVTNIPDQQYTGSAVEPLITVTCGNSILTKDKDYTVSFVNNVEVGTATAMIRAAGNSNYIGSLEAKFNIGNNVGGFIVSGYAPTYPYTGSAITPAVTVESGSTRLQQGTDYTVSYENNVDAGSASIIVKGAGKYTGTQTVNFIIEPRSIQVCDTTEVEDKTYTGDAYTPSITVRDSGKVLQNGVDYTLTYSDNVNPGLATITIQGLSNNYTGTKKITFRIGGVAVSGLQVSAVNATSIKLKWQQQGYADGYQVCNSKSKVVKTVNGGNDSTTVTGLKPGKTYKYKVRSYTTNSQGERSYSAASAVVTATTKLKTPAVTLKRKGTGRMRIKWTKSTNADGYEIFYKNTKSAKYRRIKKVDDVNTRICNVRGIKSGKKCYVRVRAYKKTGSTTLRSAMSKTKTIKVK